MGGLFLVLVASLFLFFFKHYLFDFVFQTAYQLKNKGTYGHPGGLLHAGLHALGSLPAILIFAPEMWFATVLVAGEFAVHYHVDWLKERVLKRRGWTPADFGYWNALGLDQLVHSLTYLAMMAILVLAGGSASPG